MYIFARANISRFSRSYRRVELAALGERRREERGRAREAGTHSKTRGGGTGRGRQSDESASQVAGVLTKPPIAPVREGSGNPCRGTSLIRNTHLPESPQSPRHRATLGSLGGESSILSEVPLYP